MPQFAFRKSLSFKGKPGAMATWLRLCEIEARKRDCQPFDKATFTTALQAIRGLTVRPPGVFVPQMIQLCADAGVAVALIPEIKGATVSGAAKWFSPTRAMIGLNLRRKWDDRFWFTFFHEAGHLLADSKKETYIDVDYQDDPRETKANRFATNLLIPPSHRPQLRDLRSHAAVKKFAQTLGIAPGIVVGRLQREGIVPHSHLNGLKVRLEWGN